MRTTTQDGWREWWEGSGVKVGFRDSRRLWGGEVRHACVVGSGYRCLLFYTVEYKCPRYGVQ